MRTMAMTIGALAVPAVLAVGGAGQATAGPDICVSGPYGFAYACVNTPNWVGWHPGPPPGHWKHPHGPGPHGPGHHHH